MSNRWKKAAALSYERGESAPRVSAAGRGLQAERLIAAAREAGVAIVEEPALAALLEAVEPGDYIPPWCWEAAARILAFVFTQEALFDGKNVVE
ncbi:MAG: EscU/YscU/HrcU family type III secretion system export apparatus switch protein [Treponema sp.]|jgi:type III secretion system FlhB-like substrate exporter|nr:EscU/YscU/HrcU family type III secretion system export apparatus switch protein [Treponema sp.]